MTITVEVTPWDAAEFLTDHESIAAYLNDVMADGDPALLLAALNTVARARGTAGVAQEVGIGRQALYKSLGKAGNLRLTTFLGILKSLGLKLSVSTRAWQSTR